MLGRDQPKTGRCQDGRSELRGSVVGEILLSQMKMMDFSLEPFLGSEM